MDGKIEHVLHNKSHIICSSNGKGKKLKEKKVFTKEIDLNFVETYVLTFFLTEYVLTFKCS